MYDEQDWDDTYLRMGLRYEGQRKPSEILDAILPDVMWVSEQAVEGGHDWMSAQHCIMETQAFILLAKSNPDLDINIEDDEDELDGDPEFLIMAHQVANTLEYCERGAPPFTRYGWHSDDKDDDGYYALGLWPDWDAVNDAIEKDRLLPIDSYEQLQEDHVEMHKAGFVYCIMEEGDETLIYDTSNCELAWRY